MVQTSYAGVFIATVALSAVSSTVAAPSFREGHEFHEHHAPAARGFREHGFNHHAPAQARSIFTTIAKDIGKDLIHKAPSAIVNSQPPPPPPQPKKQRDVDEEVYAREFDDEVYARHGGHRHGHPQPAARGFRGGEGHFRGHHGGPPAGVHGPPAGMHGPPAGMHGPPAGMHGPPAGAESQVPPAGAAPQARGFRGGEGHFPSHQGLPGGLRTRGFRGGPGNFHGPRPAAGFVTRGFRGGPHGHHGGPPAGMHGPPGGAGAQGPAGGAPQARGFRGGEGHFHGARPAAGPMARGLAASPFRFGLQEKHIPIRARDIVADIIHKLPHSLWGNQKLPGALHNPLPSQNKRDFDDFEYYSRSYENMEELD